MIRVLLSVLPNIKFNYKLLLDELKLHASFQKESENQWATMGKK